MAISLGKVQVFENLNLIRVLQNKLLSARSWEDALFVLLQIPRAILPVQNVSVLSFDSESNSHSVIVESTPDGVIEQPENSAYNQEGCVICQAIQEPQLLVVVPCFCCKDHGYAERLPRLCILLTKKGTRAFVLHIKLPDDMRITSSELQMIYDLAPLMRQTFENAFLKEELDRMERLFQVEKKQIARTLHDTLAHHLAYLRLKLDQLSYTSGEQDSTISALEVKQLRTVANYCYEQVRSQLTSLTEEEGIELKSALRDYLTSSSQNIEFTIDPNIESEQLNWHPTIQRKIFYIVRELLRNAEKHAKANQVRVNLSKENRSLKIEILDDGIGFDVAEVIRRKSHYGLKMIHEYTLELNGKLSINSSAETGTSISLWIPFEKEITAT